MARTRSEGRDRPAAQARRWGRTLSLYLLGEIAVPLLLGLGVFSFTFLVRQLLRITEMVVNKGLGVWHILEVVLYILVPFLGLTIPMALLLGILVAFGRLSSDREIVAMRSAGVSLGALLVPVAAVALLSFGASAFLVIYGYPWGYDRLTRRLVEMARANPSIGIRERVFTDQFEDVVIYVDKASVRGDRMEGLLIHDRRNPRTPQTIFARQGTIISDPSRPVAVLKLEKGEAETPEKKNLRRIQFGEYDLSLDLAGSSPEPSRKGRRKAREMGSAELGRTAAKLDAERGRLEDEARRLEEEGRKDEAAEKRREAAIADPRPYRIEFHKRFSVPAACLFLPLIGVPLGIQPQRAARARGFTLSIAIILLYYVVMVGGETLAEKGSLSPWLGAWLPNLALGVLGSYLLWKSWRERPVRLLLWLGDLGARARERVVAWLDPQGTAAAAGAAGPAAASPGRNPGRRPPRPSRGSGPAQGPATSRMRILTFYVAREFSTVFVLCFAAFLLIFLVVDFFERMDVFVGRASATQMTLYMLYKVPFMVVGFMLIPMALLVATLVGIGNLSMRNEMTAMKASGVNLYRVLTPIPVIGLVASLFCFWLNEWVVPDATLKSEEIKEIQVKGRQIIERIRNEDIWLRGEGRLYHVERVWPGLGGILEGVTLFDIDEDFLPTRRIDAATGRYDQENAVWKFQNAVVTELKPDGTYVREVVPSLVERLPEAPESFKIGKRDTEFMGLVDLGRYIRETRSRGYNATPYVVDWHAKIALPFACVLVPIIAIPFSLVSSRSSGGIAVGLVGSVLVAAGYFFLYSFTVALGRAGSLPPLVAAWSGNFFFTLVGAYMMTTIRQ